MEFSICFPKDASSPDSGASTPILIFISSEYEVDVSNRENHKLWNKKTKLIR